MIYCIHQDSGCQSWKPINPSLSRKAGRKAKKGRSEKRKRKESADISKQKRVVALISRIPPLSSFLASSVSCSLPSAQPLSPHGRRHAYGSCQAYILRDPWTKRKRLFSLSCSLKNLREELWPK